jgi:hypothetical protein
MWDRTRFENYWKINLLNECCKLFAKIIAARLQRIAKIILLVLLL